MATSRQPSRQEDVDKAAMILRRLLEAVEAGEIEADTPQARRLVRRLEGALGAWEVGGSG
jgi:hypothetical protein